MRQTVKIAGNLPEIEPLFRPALEENPLLHCSIQTDYYQVILTISTDEGESEEAEKQWKSFRKCIKKSLGNRIFAYDDTMTIEHSVVELLQKKNLTITTAESCTGGLFAATLINIPGSSEVISQGVITYSNKAKRKLLGVSKDTLKKYGAVSKRTAKEMASGAAIQYDSDIAIAITGIAGPDGGTEEKPVGLVYIGCYYDGKVTVLECHFTGNRTEVRNQSVICAMQLIRDVILP